MSGETSQKNASEAPTTPEDRFFQPFRAPRTDAAKAVVAEVVQAVLDFEERKRPRKRARKQVDQDVFLTMVAAVICDLVHRYLANPRGKVATPLSNRVLGRASRYRSRAMGKPLPGLLENLSAPEMGFVEMTKGGRTTVWENGEDGEEPRVYEKGVLTVISAGPRLVELIKAQDLWFDDLTRAPGEEVIVLKARKERANAPGKNLEYADTPQTVAWRKDLQMINEWLAEADIDLWDDGEEEFVDPGQRRLHRVFNNGTFEEGGRHFGGFWQRLTKERRRKDLSIEGEPIAELDYGQMAINVLYGKEGGTPPDGDQYRVPGLEGWREGVKKVLNAALAADREQKRMPANTRKLFPDHIEYRHAMAAIRQHHMPIAKHFYTGIGLKLMFEESEVMADLLLTLKDRGIVALPIYDSVMVRQSATAEVKEVMEAVFRKQTGGKAIVRTKART